MQPPYYVDIFIQPLRDNRAALAAFVAFGILVVLDVLLGLAAAAKRGEVKSSKMREGIWHKVGELGVVAIGDVLDGAMLGGVEMGFSAPVTTALLVYLIVAEALSCFENACKLSPQMAQSPLAKVLHDVAGKQSIGDGADGGTDAGE